MRLPGKEFVISEQVLTKETIERNTEDVFFVCADFVFKIRPYQHSVQTRLINILDEYNPLEITYRHYCNIREIKDKEMHVYHSHFGESISTVVQYKDCFIIKRRSFIAAVKEALHL